MNDEIANLISALRTAKQKENPRGSRVRRIEMSERDIQEHKKIASDLRRRVSRELGGYDEGDGYS